MSQQDYAQLHEEIGRLRQQLTALEAELAEERHALSPDQERAKRRWAETLYEISLELNRSLNYETVLDKIIDAVERVAPYDAACLLLLKKETARVFRWRGYTRFGAQEATTTVFKVSDVPVLQQMQEKREPVIVLAKEDNHLWPGKPGEQWAECYLSAPIFSRGQLLGVLNLDSSRPDFYTAQTIERMTVFIQIAAQALENAQQLDEARREIIRRVRVLKKEGSFISAVLDTTSALVMVLNPQGRILRFNAACEKTTGYSFEEVRGRYLWDLSSTAEEQTKLKKLFETIQPDQFPISYESRWLTREGRQSLIAWSNTAIFSQDEQPEFVISTGIDVTAQRQLEDRLTALHQLGRELNLLRDETTILRIVMETASFLFYFKSAGYGLMNETEGELDYAYYPVRGYQRVVKLKLPPELKRRINMIKQNERFLDPLQTIPQQSALNLQAPSEEFWLTVSMKIGDRLIGVLDIESAEPHRFDANDRQLLQTLADQTAVALENARLHRETQQQIEELTVLKEISQAITATMEQEEILSLIIEHAVRLLGAEAASVVLRDQSEGNLWFNTAAGGVSEFVRGKRLAEGQGIVGWVISRGEPALVLNAAQDPRFFGEFDQQTGFSTRSLICVPLQTGSETIGAIEAMNKKEGPFTAEDLRLLGMLAEPATIAIQNARLFEAERAARQQITQGHQQLRSLSRRLVELQETERRHIARELHDEAGQALTSLLVGLRLLERELEDPTAMAAKIAELKRTTNDISENLHHLAINLRPSSLDHLGLVAALRQYVDRFNDQHELIAQFEAVGLDERRLPAPVETNLYRIVQESLTNVVRHAQASRVDVLLERRQNKVVLLIEDDGIGFDPAAAKHKGRLGLLGMRERADMLGGLLSIESTPKMGATIYVEVPYDHPDSDHR